jgi:hypothetical protein
MSGSQRRRRVWPTYIDPPPSLSRSDDDRIIARLSHILDTARQRARADLGLELPRLADRDTDVRVDEPPARG